MNSLTQTIIWIPVRERLPDNRSLTENVRRPILLAMPTLYSRPIHGYFYKGDFCSDISPNSLTEFVTHWAEPLEMPFPPR